MHKHVIVRATPTNTEVELKLSASPEALKAARTHPALQSLLAGPPATVALLSTYYDTPAGELRAHGISLRVRRSNGSWLQTVKAAGSAAGGLHQRPEYEWPISGPGIDTAKLAGTPWAEAFAATAGRLKPLFKTDVSRIEQPLLFADGTRATLCLDHGSIRAGRKTNRICEIEVELIEGDPTRLYEAALGLVTGLPLSIATASKADRGYALAGTASPAPRHARDVELAPDDTTDSVMRKLGNECLSQIGTNAESFVRGADVEYLHQLRVGTRRLRSLLRLAAAATPRTVASLDALVVELHWLSNLLGPARDWDVFGTQLVSTVFAHIEDPRLRREAGALRHRVTLVRRQRGDAAIEAVGSPRFTCLMLNAALFFETLRTADTSTAGPSGDAKTFARTRLTHSAQALRKRGQQLATVSAQERHQVRIAAKKLRYSAEFFAPLFKSRRTRRYIKALSRLQAVLGQLNDFASAQRMLGELSPHSGGVPKQAQATGMLAGWIAAGELYESARIDKAWQSFAKLKPFWKR